MSFTEHDLKKIEQLAYLDSDSEEHSQLAKEVQAIMDFVEQLRQMKTEIAPLFHPLELPQPLRPDKVSEQDCREQLAEIASLFEDGLYQVPKIIDSGQ